MLTFGVPNSKVYSQELQFDRYDFQLRFLNDFEMIIWKRRILVGNNYCKRNLDMNFGHELGHYTYPLFLFFVICVIAHKIIAQQILLRVIS